MELAKSLEGLTPEQWDDLDFRLGTATSIPTNEAGSLSLARRLSDNYPSGFLPLHLAGSLVLVLVSAGVRERFKTIASPKVIEHVERLRSRHGSVIGPLWSAYAEAFDWARQDTLFTWVFMSDGGQSRLRVVTYRRDGEQLMFETTAGGFLRYIGSLIWDVVHMPSQISDSLTLDDWQGLLDDLKQASTFASKAKKSTSSGGAAVAPEPTRGDSTNQTDTPQ